MYEQNRGWGGCHGRHGHRRGGPFGRGGDWTGALGLGLSWLHERWHGRWGEDLIDDDAKLGAVLEALKDQPASGLDVTQALERKLGGLFNTGPTGIYPLLQMATDLGYVSEETQDGRKIYTLTEAGHAYVASHAEELASFWERAETFRTRSEIGSLFRDVKGLAVTIGRELHHGKLGESVREGRLDHEQIARIREIMAKARREIEQQLAG